MDNPIDKLRSALAPTIPSDVEKRVNRAVKNIKEDAYKVRLCQLFLRGDVYFYLDNQGVLNSQATAPGVRSGKPRHRVRNRYNFIRPMVDSKVSSATTRVPGYEVTPTTTDPEAAAASRLAEKVLRAKYETWNLRETRVKGATLAIGGGGSAFALPYFDGSVGPFRQVLQSDGSVVTQGEGEVKILLLNANEVGWETGVDFNDSRWYVVRTARPISEVRSMPGYNGAGLVADARVADLPTEPLSQDLTMITMYFERPSAKTPKGRMLTMSGIHQIVPEEPYPMVHGTEVLDEPAMHRLVYRADPDKDHDLGLTWELIDFQRTLQDIYNKIVEIKNRGLGLRMMAPEGSLIKAPGEEPLGIDYYRPVGGMKPEWEKAPDPAIIGQLLNVFDRVLNDMRYVAADTDVQAAPNVATGSIQAELQQASNRWSQFMGSLARWDSEIARHCLMLVQNHYNEDRILKVKGRFGWEPDQSFRGADIMGQVSVTVNPATIESHSKVAMLQQLGWIQANFPGYVRPEIAIEIALNGASPDSIIESFEFDKARINSIIQKIRDGSIMEMQSRQESDPMTGALNLVPGWMPRPFDNLDIQMWVYENWLKTDDADKLPVEMHAVAMLIYEGLKQLQAQHQAEDAAAQSATAQALGEKNAAAPQEAKPMPSTPNPAGGPQ